MTKRALVLTVLVVALAAACGGQNFPTARTQAPNGPPATHVPPAANASPRTRLLSAVRLTDASRSARFSLGMTISGYSTGFTSGRQTTVTGTGVLDLTKQEMMMTFDEEGDGDTVMFEMRLVGGVMYVHTDDDGWESEPYTATKSDTPDPGGYLNYLQGVAGDVRVEGHEVIGGDDTTRYGATIDLERALAATQDPARRASLLHAIALVGDLKMPATVWVDDSGRLRKLQLSLDLAAVAKQLGAPPGIDPKIVETMELYDYGVQVDVQAPPNATSAQDRAVESDLRNALTAEKVLYTDQQLYSEDLTTLRQIEPSLDWGGKLTVAVGTSMSGPFQVVCVSERSESGMTYAIADVAGGPSAGTYYGKAGCPASVSDDTVSGLDSSW